MSSLYLIFRWLLCTSIWRIDQALSSSTSSLVRRYCCACCSTSNDDGDSFSQSIFTSNPVAKGRGRPGLRPSASARQLQMESSPPLPQQILSPATMIARERDYLYHCMRIVRVIPLHLEYQGLNSHVTTELVVSKCVQRFHALSGNVLLERTPKNKKKEHRTPNSTKTRHLVVLDLNTLFDSSIITKHIDPEHLLAHNYRDFVFNYIPVNQSEMNLPDPAERLIIYRQEIMDLIHTTLTARIISLENDAFDYAIYSDGDPFQVLYNAVAMEMYYNWYFLGITAPRDKLQSSSMAARTFLNFKFLLMSDCGQKSLGTLNQALKSRQASGDRYHKLVIVDSEQNWDWGSFKTDSVYPILGPSFVPRAGYLDYEELAKQWQDQFGKLLYTALAFIDTTTAEIDALRNGSSAMKWYKMDRGYKYIPVSDHTRTAPTVASLIGKKKEMQHSQTRKSPYRGLDGLDGLDPKQFTCLLSGCENVVAIRCKK